MHASLCSRCVAFSVFPLVPCPVMFVQLRCPCYWCSMFMFRVPWIHFSVLSLLLAGRCITTLPRCVSLLALLGVCGGTLSFRLFSFLMFLVFFTCPNTLNP
ncbi:hypothetical protein EDD85DRAFT_804270 [Armillaria nabsnona]|nr:hypothetical protein EDD85DRAFT_804270 [Armillaria nabsnona]